MICNDNEIRHNYSPLGCIFPETTARDLVRLSDNKMDNQFPQYLRDSFERVMDIRFLLNNESDRGCALLATSFINVELKELLLKCFVQDFPMDNRISADHSPYISFSSRINGAYYLGKISADLKQEIHLLRRIRNDFGYDPKPITFATEQIENRCRELRWSQKADTATARQHFTASICGVIAYIHTATFQAEPPTAAEGTPSSGHPFVEL